MQTATILCGKVLMERGPFDLRVQMVYWGAGNPLTVQVIANECPSMKIQPPESELLDCYHHPYRDRYEKYSQPLTLADLAMVA